MRWWVVCFGIAMFSFAVANLVMTLTPAAEADALIDTEFQDAQALPAGAKINAFKELRDDQAWTLAQRPSDPYGWARLAYLRLATTGDMKSALEALAMSDFVSPYEGPQLPERAVMWYRFRSVETPEQQAYQDALWHKAAIMADDMTWQMAVQNKLVDQAIASLQKTDPTLSREWQGRKANLR
jgi:hypothetical protein